MRKLVVGVVVIGIVAAAVGSGCATSGAGRSVPTWDASATGFSRSSCLRPGLLAHGRMRFAGPVCCARGPGIHAPYVEECVFDRDSYEANRLVYPRHLAQRDPRIGLLAGRGPRVSPVPIAAQPRRYDPSAHGPQRPATTGVTSNGGDHHSSSAASRGGGARPVSASPRSR